MWNTEEVMGKTMWNKSCWYKCELRPTYVPWNLALFYVYNLSEKCYILFTFIARENIKKLRENIEREQNNSWNKE